jgi:hypothetical protein
MTCGRRVMEGYGTVIRFIAYMRARYALMGKGSVVFHGEGTT